MFAWHTEDLDMCSINYLHYGAPKFWYFVSSDDMKKFEGYVKNKYSEAFLECPHYFRHKTIVVNPYLVKEYNPFISITKVLQEPGEFVVIFDSVYHHGFNFGFNMAEAVNFATPHWLARFPKFGSCKCHKDNVRIDPVSFCDNLAKSQLISTGI